MIKLLIEEAEQHPTDKITAVHVVGLIKNMCDEHKVQLGDQS